MKGKLIVTFKLIEPINIDELDAIENFIFICTSTVNGKSLKTSLVVASEEFGIVH